MKETHSQQGGKKQEKTNKDPAAHESKAIRENVFESV